MAYTIYLVTNKINNKKYIGITSRRIAQRWYEHRREDSNCIALKGAINKYGENNFTIEKVFSSFDKELAYEKECYYIKEFNTLQPHGYNLTEGGKDGSLSEETKAKMKISQNYRWKSEEQRNYYSKWLTEQHASNPELKAKRVSGIKKYVEEKKRHLIAINIFTLEIKEYSNMRESVKDGFSPGSLYQNLSRRDIHCKNHVFFYKEEGIDYISETLKHLDNKGFYDHKPIKAINIETGEEVLYSNIKDIREPFDIRCVRHALLGKKPHYRKFRWIIINK